MNYNEVYICINKTALYLAVENNNFEIVKSLLTKRQY